MSSFQMMSQDINFDDLIINSNTTADFSGNLILKGKQIIFKSNDCLLSTNEIALKSFENKEFKGKKLLKKLKKNKGVLRNAVIKGILSDDKKSIAVKKVNSPLNNPRIWSEGVSSLYLAAATVLYQKTIDLRENYKVFSISVEEVEDASLGSVTEYSIYNQKCKKLSPDEIKNISEKELSALNASVEIGGGLLIKQAALLELAKQSAQELKQLGALKKIAPGKDAATATVFQAAIIGQLPKTVKNLQASKKYIEQLQAE